MSVLVLPLIVVAVVLAVVALSWAQSKAQALTAWGLLALAGALLIERL
jgi:hypothetical protein